MKHRYVFGIVELIPVLLFLILCIFTFANPDRALTAFVYVYGIAAILGGIALYTTLESRTGFGPVNALVSDILNIFRSRDSLDS